MKKKYRLLVSGEIIKEGDQYKDGGTGRWKDINKLPTGWDEGIEGEIYETFLFVPYRRVIEEEEE